MNSAFVLNKGGVAVVIAESYEEALQLLKDKEATDGCPEYLSGGVVPGDFAMLSPEEMPKGVHTYHAD